MQVLNEKIFSPCGVKCIWTNPMHHDMINELICACFLKNGENR